MKKILAYCLFRWGASICIIAMEMYEGIEASGNFYFDHEEYTMLFKKINEGKKRPAKEGE